MHTDPDTATLYFDRFRVDRARAQLWAGDRRIELRPKCWELLLYLLDRGGELVTVPALLEALWPGQDVTPKALTNRIAELRTALGDDVLRPRVIQTLHRRGYRLIASVGPAPLLTSAPSTPPLPTGAAPPLQAAPSRCFVGRASERAHLEALAAAAMQGSRQIVLLSGDGGMGKSALVDAFLADAPLHGALTGRVVCLEQSSEREPFGPWLSLLTELAAGPGAAQVRLLLRRCAPSWLVQLPWLLQGEEAQQLRASLQGSAAGRMLREACVLLETLSQQTPLLLVLEDLHWSDAASIDLLAHLAQGRGLARLMVVTSARGAEAALHGHPYAGAARRLVAQGQAVRIELPPLAPAEVAACVQGRFGASVAGSVALLDVLQRQSEGHPLFLTATLDHLVERGVLQQQANGWQLTTDAAQLNPGLPEAARQTMQARLSLLDDDARQLLQAASVIGMQCPLPLLQAVLQRPADTLQAACESLVHGPALLRHLPPQPWPGGVDVPAWRFGHDAYRRVLYDSLGSERRQALHGRVAQALEAAWQGRQHEVTGALVVAYERSAQPAEAARVLELAAGVAVRRYAYREAAVALQAALAKLALLPPDPARDRVEQRLQLSLAGLGRLLGGLTLEQQQGAYLRAHELAVQLGDVLSQARACRGLSLSAVLRGRPDEADPWSRNMVRLAEAHLPDLRAAAQCYAALTELASGDCGRALAALDRALQLPPEPGPVVLDEHALAGAQRAWVLALAAREHPARQQLEHTLQRARSHCAPMDLAQNLHWLGRTCQLLGDDAQAASLIGESLALADELDLPFYRTLGNVALQQLRAPSQRDHGLDEAVLAHEALGESCYCLPHLLLLAETRLLRGEHEAAGQALARAAALRAAAGMHAGEQLRLQTALLAGARPELLDDEQDAAVRRAYRAAIDGNLASGTLAWALRAGVALLQHTRLRGDGEAQAVLLGQLLQRCEPGSSMPDVVAARAALALPLPA